MRVNKTYRLNKDMQDLNSSLHLIEPDHMIMRPHIDLTKCKSALQAAA